MMCLTQAHGLVPIRCFANKCKSFRLQQDSQSLTEHFMVIRNHNSNSHQ